MCHLMGGPETAGTVRLAKQPSPMAVSWPYPSTGFQLQRNGNLTTTNWTGMATIPVQVGDKWRAPVSPPVGNKFYR